MGTRGRVWTLRRNARIRVPTSKIVSVSSSKWRYKDCLATAGRSKAK